MKKQGLYTVVLMMLSIGVLWHVSQNPTTDIERAPIPGEDTQIKAESDHSERDAWIELLHKTAPGVDWRQIEAETRLARHEQRKKMRKEVDPSVRNQQEVLANGNLVGEWRERGSKNQAGRTLATVYDQKNDWIYLISAGGNLWRGKRDGSQWQIVNQDLRFHSRFLHLMDHDGQPRLLSMVNKVPFYSDDMGVNWESSEGLNTYDNWGGRRHPVTVPDSLYTFLLVQEWLPGPWRPDVGIYRSNDHGEYYDKIHSFGNIDFDNYVVSTPHHSNEVLIMGTNQSDVSELYKYNYNGDSLQLLQTFDDILYGNGVRANLTATVVDSQMIMYSYNDSLDLYISYDTAANWNKISRLPNKPWEVGLWISPSNPDVLLYGNIECWRSINGGQSWSKINDWGAYYGDVENKLHADMMYFNEFQTAQGETFILISNDGGLNISYDYLQTVPNIGLQDLNVSRYYDVVTDPLGGLTLFAGSQDQGFQRGGAFSDLVVMDFEQVISGDYGHIVFSNNDKHLWVVYPGGWVSYYEDPIFGTLTYSWTLESDNESVWIPPLMASPSPGQNAVYMAGGNKDGGPGSHIIQLKVENGDIQPTQLPFDFKQESGGEVSAMAVSPLNPEKWYAATTNGLFYFSEDGGNSWEVSAQVGPSPQYLYGNSIYPSKLDENVVYFAGSGYSTFPVYKSDDGGRFFSNLSDGMPKTVVMELTANEDESMLFAATEAGPFVYVQTEEEWFDMSGLAAPAQTYWSVEYLAEKEIVRYGTYGRGIWDFKIDTDVTSISNASANANLEFRTFPNPANEIVHIELQPTLKGEVVYELLDGSGKIIRSEIMEGPRATIQTGALTPGIYVVRIRNNQATGTTKLVVQ